MVRSPWKPKRQKNTYKCSSLNVQPAIEEEDEIDTEIDIMLIGNQYVGKTSFLFQLCEHSYCEPYMPTIGIDWKSRVETAKEFGKVRVRLWDICKSRVKNFGLMSFVGLFLMEHRFFDIPT